MRKKPEEFITNIAKYLASKGGMVHLSKPDRSRLRKKVFLIDDEKEREEWNDILLTLRCSDLTPSIDRTEKGQIRNTRANKRGVWDLTGKEGGVGMLITAIVEGYYFSYFLTREMADPTLKMSGHTAYVIFKKKCKEEGINLDDYKIDNGKEVNNTIPKPKIWMKYIMTEKDEGIPNCHHIDFHNSYPAGLCNIHPEFRPVVEYFYNGRKEHPQNKSVLNNTIGFMHSDNISWSYAHLAKDAITDNNNRIDALAARLIESGREILGFNTDGIWYCGEIYHGEGEGKHLGEWENDHVNCIFRSKSDGAYEFIENDKYYPVLRGKTNFDEIKPRTDWSWGDIFNNDLKIKVHKMTKYGVLSKEVSLDEAQ